MRSAADVLASVEFPDQKTLLPELNRLMQAFTALEAESWDAITKPKAARRPALGQEFMDNTAALLDVLEKTSTRIAAVEEQGTATQEISRSTQHAAQRTRNVSENITGVKTDADAAAAAAENVKHASEMLEMQSLQLSSHRIPRQDPRGLIIASWPGQAWLDPGIHALLSKENVDGRA
jgi:hypothetical protein